MSKFTRVLWLIIAAIFLFEAWLWDMAVLFGRWCAARIPWYEFKESIERWIKSLPPKAALILFLIPLLVIEPFNIIALALIAHGRIFLGIIALIFAKLVGLGAIAFLFDLTRDKLLTIDWFARFYRKMLIWRDWAHALIEPHKQALHTLIEPYRQALSAFVAEWRSEKGFFANLAKFRRRIRRRSHGRQID